MNCSGAIEIAVNCSIGVIKTPRLLVMAYSVIKLLATECCLGSISENDCEVWTFWTAFWTILSVRGRWKSSGWNCAIRTGLLRNRLAKSGNY